MHFGGMRITIDEGEIAAQAQETEKTQIMLQEENGALRSIELTAGEKRRFKKNNTPA